ncbi:hypothetical protein SLE2022_165900 [Rubroshorea leprosula]
MESKTHVSVSAAGAKGNPNERTFSSPSSTGSFLIRAPLTIDDDSDFESSGGYSGVDGSGGGSGSEYLSGEEFETASERPSMAGETDEEMVEENDGVGRYTVSRPFVADSDHGSVENSVADEEDNFVSVVENLESKQFTPVAQLSMDDEFDEMLGDEEMVSDAENGGFSGAVKFPGGVNSLPKIKAAVDVEVGGEEEESLDPTNSALGNQSESSSNAEVQNGVLENLVVEEVSHGDIPKAPLESMVESKEDIVGEILKLDRDESGVVNVGGTVATDSGSKSEKLESQTELEVDLGAELLKRLSATEVEYTECAVENNGFPTLQPSESSQSFSIQEIVNIVKDGVPKINGSEPSKDAFPSDGILTVDSAEISQPISTREVVNNGNNGWLEITQGDKSENSNQVEGEKVVLSNEDIEELIFGSPETNQRMNELDQGLASPSHSKMDSQDHSETADSESQGMELFDSAALAALLKAATGVEPDGGSIRITPKDGSKVFSVKPPFHSDSSNIADIVFQDNVSDEEKKIIEKIQLLKVKFLRLVHRLGLSPNDSLVEQVLYRLALATRSHSSLDFSLESAKKAAMKLEAEGKEDLGFSLDILVLGKTGVGKSATINSILCEEKARVDAFEPATTSVKDIVGTVNGVKMRIFDTPGLRSPTTDAVTNRKILASIKKLTRKIPPDVVLYVDRLDTNARDLMDLLLLKSFTSSLGSSIWQNAIITLTHAASAPPDGPSGSPLSYDIFVAQKSHVVQRALSQAVGDLRLMNPSMVHPVSLVENHTSYQKNRDGESMLPNGQSWRPHLLLLCYSMKILSEANSIAKPQDAFDFRKLLGLQLRSSPLPYLLSSLLQSRAHPKLSTDHGGDNVDSDVELGNSSDSDQEDDDEYDQLPPFKPLGRSQVAKLSKEQRKAYFEEYDYRVKLLQKKQWREEVKRLREMKKRGKEGESNDMYKGEEGNPEDGGPETVPVPLPDMILPPSFDGDNPAYRYRLLESASQLLVRPVLDSQGWDHDFGYDGVSLEGNLAIAGCFPGAVAVQITKDKKDFNIHLDSSVCAKMGEKGSTMAGFDIQAVGRQLAYILRGETKFKILTMNKAAAGLSVTLLGENIATGLKVEDQITVGKRLVLSGGAGTMRSQGETAYGANLEVCLNDKNFPIEQNQTTLGLSLMKWRGDLGVMANLQSQFSIGRSSKMAVRVGLNNKQSGQITFKVSSAEHLQIALSAILPVAISIFRNMYPGTAAKGSTY